MELKLEKIKGITDGSKGNAFVRAIKTGITFNSIKERDGVDVDKLIINYVYAVELIKEKHFSFFSGKKITELASYFFHGNSSDTHQLRILASYVGKNFNGEWKLNNVKTESDSSVKDVYMRDIIDYLNDSPEARKKYFDNYFLSSGNINKLNTTVDFMFCKIKCQATLNVCNLWNLTIPYIMEHYDSAVFYVNYFYPGMLKTNMSQCYEYEYDDEIKPEALPPAVPAKRTKSIGTAVWTNAKTIQKKSVVEVTEPVMPAETAEDTINPTNICSNGNEDHTADRKASDIDPEYIDLIITDEASKILPADVNIENICGAVRMFCSIHGNMSASVFKNMLPKMNKHLKACVPEDYIANAVCTMIEKEL